VSAPKVALTLAVRVYPEPQVVKRAQQPQKIWRIPSAMFVFDTETGTDAAQRLTFGSYQFYVVGRCLEEGLFYADDLPPKDRRILEEYVKTHEAQVAVESRGKIHLFTRREFLRRLFKAVYKGRCLLVGFNLPFDLSRVAFDSAAARGRFAGGFSLALWSYFDKSGIEHADPHRPRIGIKQIDNKRHLKGFTARNEPDRIDLIPEGSQSGKPEQGYKFRGHFLDLRTLAFALTDRSYSLDTACKAFGIEHGKQHAAHHGEVTPEYIDYNRRDVLATAELAAKLIEEYSRHPITLQITRAYSPASIGKAYLRAMGVEPILARQPDFPKEFLGYAQSAFFGGRTSAHIRKVSVPVVYTDFLSMYPTVNSLMRLWGLQTAREITVLKNCGPGIERFLRNFDPNSLFDPSTWELLSAFVKIIPDGVILPSRAKYSIASNDWQVGINHLYGNANNPNHALWFSLPDIVASVLLTGRVPRIIDAFRLKPYGTLPTLRSTALPGEIPINPRRQDFFKMVIEERKRLSKRSDLSPADRDRLDKEFKVIANATSYGIFAEMQRQETDDKVNVKCHGIDLQGFNCRVSHPDVPGEYCFPPVASLITGGARLMLALLEYCVAEKGGTYAMEDTDSMAIVATQRGGIIPCPGGPYRGKNEQSAIKALSWRDVESIQKRFESLNPYNREIVPGSILKIEDDNFDPASEKQRQLYCLAISAKRYTLFLRNRKGDPELLRSDLNNKNDRWSEHGLGHLLNPTDPESDDRDWIAQAWLRIVRRADRLSTKSLALEQMPAVGRFSISSPAALKPLAGFNQGNRYGDQIKPFNFLLSCHISPLGHPMGVDPSRFHLLAPYESDSRKWLTRDWIDQYTGSPYRITTRGFHGDRNTARVKTFGDVLTDYEFHPESKCGDADGNACNKQTVGLLHRRHIQIGFVKFIGKESNSLVDVESGIVHNEHSVYTEYSDQGRDEWQMLIRPALRRLSLSELKDECRGRMSRRELINLRAGRSRPHRKNVEMLKRIVQKRAE